ncbi:MAG TPA: FAD:protein FMN transferase [Candidatus Dormibacteraeota bacterium]|nr:FAD:protein FMN transferase [Candidatus Dormibacteraeota bacterium]
MPVTVQVLDSTADDSMLDEVFEEFARLDQTFSPFLDGSAVSRINRGELSVEEAGPLVVQAAELCRLYEVATGGYFSAWPGGRFEPSGLVKGWAIDRSASILARHACDDWFVDAGGDVLAHGHNGDGGPWRVGIRHPVERNRVVRVVLASDLAVATSGTYEKGEHILDPHTGKPATELVSFTVAGPDILSADVYATACFAMGSRGLDFLDGVEGYEGLAVDRELRGAWTAGFAALCEGA